MITPTFSVRPNIKSLTPTPTWEALFQHTGSGLTPVLESLDLPIKTGAEYLMTWVATMFKEPDQRIPFLFLYGEQHSGKSMFHRALGALLLDGYMQGDYFLRERKKNIILRDGLLLFLEESDFSKQSVEPLIDLSGVYLHLDRPGLPQIKVTNSLHWIQCGNDISQAPKLYNVTRICLPTLGGKYTPNKDLMAQLGDEAPSFFTKLLRYPILPVPLPFL